MGKKHLCAIKKFDEKNLSYQIHDALEWVNWKEKIYPDSRIFVKPNLTFPKYLPGVTTSPQFMAALLDVLNERCKHITVCEADGGNNSYPAEDAFKAHNLYEICESRNVRLMSLSREEQTYIDVPARGKIHQLPLCKEMVEHSDMTISVPVPKMHFVTRFTCAIKNHWGTVPDSMRLKNHYFFKYAITEIMKALKSGITVVDGGHFLDNNGPVMGEPVRMDLLFATDCPLTADLALMDIMGVDPKDVAYIQTAIQKGLGPASLDEISFNDNLESYKTHTFTYHRDPVDYLALLGFHSRFITWLAYLSPFNVFMHDILRVLRGGSRQVESYYTGIDHHKKGG